MLGASVFDCCDRTGKLINEVKQILGVPVVVVLDVYGMTRTTAALMDGINSFDPEVKIAGFILNRCGYAGSEVHKNLIKNAVGAKRCQQPGP